MTAKDFQPDEEITILEIKNDLQSCMYQISRWDLLVLCRTMEPSLTVAALSLHRDPLTSPASAFRLKREVAGSVRRACRVPMFLTGSVRQPSPAAHVRTRRSDFFVSLDEDVEEVKNQNQSNLQFRDLRCLQVKTKSR